jgi:hypothetical protein
VSSALQQPTQTSKQTHVRLSQLERDDEDDDGVEAKIKRSLSLARTNLLLLATIDRVSAGRFQCDCSCCPFIVSLLK